MRKIIVGFALVVGLAAHAQVVINELYYDSPGTDAGCFTELYGPPGTNLSGWRLYGVNGFNGLVIDTIDLSGTIPADSFFVIAQDATVPNYDMIDVDADWQNGPDNVLLYNGSTRIDGVGYGSFTAPDTFFVGEGQPAPDAPAGQCLYRAPDGDDVNNNAVDFSLGDSLTPGDNNPPPVVAVQRTIYQIQYTTDPGGASPDTGLYVYTTGVVTSDTLPDPGNKVIAEGPGAWHAIFIYGFSFGVNIGDSVTVYGTVSEYNGKTELMLTQFTLHGAGTVPSPNTVQVDQINTGSATAESYEATLCRVLDVVVNDTLTFGEWQVTDGFENLSIDNSTGIYTYTPVIGDTLDITGVLNYTYSNFKLAPRGDFDIITDVPDGPSSLPARVTLEQNAPNPFNPATTISFVLPENANVSLDLYNVLGQRVATLVDGPMPAGRHSVAWDAGGAPSGVYFYRLRAGGVALARSMVLAK